MLEVDVMHGRAIDLAFQLEPRQPSAGEQVVLQLVAEDVKGNRWVVDGNITMGMGAADELTDDLTYSLIQAQSARSWKFDGSWFDNTTGAMFTADVSFRCSTRSIGLYRTRGEGSRVPADGSLDLNPMFFDAYGNELEPIALNWSLNGNDITLEMLLNDGRWTATSVGGHELRVNADGVFATVRLTVVAGNAHGLITDADEGLVVNGWSTARPVHPGGGCPRQHC